MASEKVVASDEDIFGRQLHVLRAKRQQCADFVKEISTNTRKIKVFKSPDQQDNGHIILSDQSSLILYGHISPVICIAWSPQENFLATGSCDGTVVIWEMKNHDSGECEVFDNPSVYLPDQSLEKMCDITCISWNQTGNMLAVGNHNGLVSIIVDNQVITITSLQSPVVSMSFNNNDLLICGSLKGNIVIATKDSIIRSFKSFGGDVIDIAWISDKSAVYASGSMVYSIDADSDEQKSLFQTQNSITQMCLDISQETIAVIENTGSVTLFSLNGNKRVEPISHKPILCITWSSIPQSYAVGISDGKIALCILSELTPIIIDEHFKAPFLIVFDPLGRYFASAGFDGVVIIYSISQNSVITSYISNIPILDMSWSPDGRILCLALESGAVSLIDFELLC